MEAMEAPGALRMVDNTEMQMLKLPKFPTTKKITKVQMLKLPKFPTTTMMLTKRMMLFLVKTVRVLTMRLPPPWHQWRMICLLKAVRMRPMVMTHPAMVMAMMMICMKFPRRPRPNQDI